MSNDGESSSDSEDIRDSPINLILDGLGDGLQRAVKDDDPNENEEISEPLTSHTAETPSGYQTPAELSKSPVNLKVYASSETLASLAPTPNCGTPNPQPPISPTSRQRRHTMMTLGSGVTEVNETEEAAVISPVARKTFGSFMHRRSSGPTSDTRLPSFMLRPRARTNSLGSGGGWVGRSGGHSFFRRTTTTQCRTTNLGDSEEAMEVVQKMFTEKDPPRIILDSDELELTKILSTLLSTVKSFTSEISSEIEKELYEEIVGKEKRDLIYFPGTLIYLAPFLPLVESPPGLAMVRLVRQTNLGAPDDSLTRFVCLALAPAEEVAKYASTLATVLLEVQFHSDLIEASTLSQIEIAYSFFHRRTVASRTVVLHDGDEHRDSNAQWFKDFENFAADYSSEILSNQIPRKRSKRGEFAAVGSRFPFKGIYCDLLTWLPLFVDDIKAFAISTKPLLSVLFMFSATVAPGAAFGGLLAAKTNSHMGVPEMLISQSLFGIIFSVIGGNPMQILGPTGAAVTFIAGVYELAERNEYNFLQFYGVTCFWTALFLFIMAVSNFSFIIRRFTPFCQDIFETLISTMFLADAIKYLITEFTETHVTAREEAIFAVAILIFTAWVAISLKDFKDSVYLGPKARMFLSDFGMTIALVLASILTAIFRSTNYVFIARLKLESVFGSFHPTAEFRPWFVDVSTLPQEAVALALYPGFLMAVCLFTEHNSTSISLSDPANCIRRGITAHWDTLLLSFFCVISGLLGIPILHASNPYSPMHIRTLATLEEQHINGKIHRIILRVQENRVSPFLLSISVGCVLFLLPVIELVPKSAVFGVFLFLGFTTIKDSSFFDRFILMFTERSLYAPDHIARKVKPFWKVHMYTGIQVVMLVIVWAVKLNQEVLFPLIIIAIVPFRTFIMKRIFSKNNLEFLESHRA